MPAICSSGRSSTTCPRHVDKIQRTCKTRHCMPANTFACCQGDTTASQENTSKGTITLQHDTAYQSVGMLVGFIKKLLQVFGCGHSLHRWQFSQHLQTHPGGELIARISAVTFTLARSNAKLEVSKKAPNPPVVTLATLCPLCYQGQRPDYLAFVHGHLQSRWVGWDRQRIAACAAESCLLLLLPWI